MALEPRGDVLAMQDRTMRARVGIISASADAIAAEKYGEGRWPGSGLVVGRTPARWVPPLGH